MATQGKHTAATHAGRAKKTSRANGTKSEAEINAPTSHKNWPINRIHFKCWLPIDLADADIDWSPVRKMDETIEL
jgi:beta-lactamase superfamily II metal-dependent hydrolase